MAEERLVLITGAGRGVGLATVKALLRRPGIRVLALSRQTRALTELHTLSKEAMLEHAIVDLLAPEAIGQVKAMVGGRRLHGLVHNAGLLHKADMGGHQRADLERLFATNVLLPLELSQALVEELDGDPPGHIVHIGSMGGFQDSSKFPGLVAYSSSKAAVACMAQCLAEEFKHKGIRSNCLALGAVDTDMLRDAFPGFQAPVSAEQMGCYVAEFLLEGHKLFNGKVLPVAVSTP
jgi:NAD(P)-dependent dehydrogenase (short-subunit alcohol dehydrogenase family)